MSGPSTLPPPPPPPPPGVSVAAQPVVQRAPRRIWIHLALLALVGGAIVAGAVWLAGLAIDALVVRISPERERALLEPLVAQIERGEPAERERLDRLFERLAPISPAPIVGVVDSEESNAFALPGRAIVVTRGLLAEIEDDDELAFVLAHELAHLEHRDNLRALGRAVAWGLALAWLGVDSSDLFDLSAVTGRLALARHSRGRESEADRSALHRLVASGVPPDAAVRLLERLSAREASSDRALSWLASHPLGAERIAAVRLEASRIDSRPAPQPPPSAR